MTLAGCRPRTDLTEVAWPFVTVLLGLCDVALLASLCFRSLVRSAKNVSVLSILSGRHLLGVWACFNQTCWEPQPFHIEWD